MEPCHVWCGSTFFLSPRWGFVRNLYFVGKGSIAFHLCLLFAFSMGQDNAIALKCPVLPFFRTCNSKGQNISICNARMNNAPAVVRQPYSPGGVV